MNFKIKLFDNTEYRVHFKVSRYGINNRLKIDLYDGIQGAVLTLTVNLPERSLMPDEIFVKDYAENKGVIDQLVNLGVVSKPLETIYLYDKLPVHKCKLLKIL